MERYNHLNQYLKNKFGKRTLKICIDGGFTCPNRDGKKSTGGCIFCGAGGAGENICGKKSDILLSIKNQVRTFLDSYRGDRADSFIAYFQAFSGTYDSVENLKLKYDTALCESDKIVGLQVATRPDLITKEIANLLASYKDKYYVCVELGLQTANDEVGDSLNRHYKTVDFVNACNILKSVGVDVVGHIMIGLPNEKDNDILETIDIMNACVNGVKIHNTYIVKNTKLLDMYNNSLYTPISFEYYVEKVAEIISRLRPDIIIHRITGDPPKSTFVSPDWALHKKIILNKINRFLEEKDIFQGKTYRSKT